MSNKMILALALILLSFITISGVSASEITGDTSDLLSNTYDDSINVNDEVPDGTFKDLAREITDADGELNLTRNYVYSKGDDDYKSGINIGEKITINGNGFDIDGNGQVIYDYLKLNDGEYNLTAYHADDSYYTYIKTSGTFTVDKCEVNLSAVYDDHDKVLIVGLVDAVSGAPLKGANVAVNIAGEKYTVKINSKGEGRISVADFDYGTYAVTISYKGNAKYAPTTVDLDVVFKDAVNLSAVYDDNTKELTVTLVDAVSGAPLKGASVPVTINNVKQTVKITSTGQGKLSLADLPAGTYTAAVSYKGNAKYAPAETIVDVVKK